VSDGVSSTEDEKSDSEVSVPRGASLIGIDDEGRKHYFDGPIVHQIVYVVDGDEMEVFDIEQDAGYTDLDQWVEHVRRKVGWRRNDYEKSLGDLLVESLEGIEEANKETDS
jgi:hypothetical protein